MSNTKIDLNFFLKFKNEFNKYDIGILIAGYLISALEGKVKVSGDENYTTVDVKIPFQAKSPHTNAVQPGYANASLSYQAPTGNNQNLINDNGSSNHINLNNSKDLLSMTRRNVSPMSGNGGWKPVSQNSSSKNESDQIMITDNNRRRSSGQDNPNNGMYKKNVVSLRDAVKRKAKKPRSKLSSKSGIIDQKHIEQKPKKKYTPRGISSFANEIKKLTFDKSPKFANTESLRLIKNKGPDNKLILMNKKSFSKRMSVCQDQALQLGGLIKEKSFESDDPSLSRNSEVSDSPNDLDYEEPENYQTDNLSASIYEGQESE